MASTRDQRKVDVVRRFLGGLADSSGNAIEGRKSIDSIASEWEVNANHLRDFRDGNTEALNRDFVNAFARLLGRPDSSMLGMNIDDILGFSDTSVGGYYGALLAEEYQRSARLRHFHHFDTIRPEVHSAHDAWADLGVTGNIGDVARYNGGYEAVTFDGTQAAKKVISDCSDDINYRILPDDQKWLVFRGMVKYGTQYGELGFAPKAGRMTVNVIEPRHARTMFVHRDPESGAYDWKKAYKQIMPGKSFSQVDAFFPEYKIIQFSNTKNWGDLYGEAILNSCLRSVIQVEAMENAMIIRRLERASMRYKHFVDVGLIDGGEDAVAKELQEYRRKLTKIKTVDQSRNMRTQKITLPPGEDIFVPKRDKESPADVIPLGGDATIGEISDFLHFLNKLFSGLGPPKAHLGYEGETMRSVITDLHIVFARKVRRLQLKFLAGLNKIYWIQLVCAGIDPRSVRFQIFPPALGTRDELVRAQVQLAHATTCRYLSQAFSVTGEQPSIRWMLQKIMGMDDETLESLEMAPIIQQAAGGNNFKNDPPSGGPKELRDPDMNVMAAIAQTNPEVMESVDHLQFLLEERAVAKRLPWAMKGFSKWTSPSPFGDNFEDVVRGMGITHLARVA